MSDRSSSSPATVDETQTQTQLLEDMPKEGAKAWLQAFGSFLVYIATWGLLSSYGLYQSYYETTLLAHVPLDTIAWVGTVEGVLLILGGVITGPIYDRGYVRELILIGTILTVLGVMMLSLATQYYQVLLAQGFCVGIGSGILYTPSIAVVAATFGPRYRALAVCFATSGTAVGGILYPLVFKHLLPAVGFAWATRVLGFVTLVALIIALPIIVPDASKATPAAQGRAARSLVDFKALQEPVFAVFCLALFFMWIAYWVPFFLIPTYAQFGLGASADWGLNLLIITNAATLAGRLLAVAIIPYVGVAGGMLAFSLGSAIVLYAWLAVKTMAGFEVWIVILGIVIAPLAVFFPAIVPQMCPSKDVVGTWLGMGSAAAALGVVIGAPLSSALIDIETGEFWKMEVFIAVCMTTGGILMSYVWWRLRKQAPK